MRVTIPAKPLEIEVEVPGYGIFYVKHLGAGLDAAIQARLDIARQTMDNISNKYVSLIKQETKLMKANDEAGLTNLRETEVYKNAKKEQDECNRQLQDAVKFANKCQLELWRSDDPKALEKFFNDFSLKEIQGFYAQVMAQEKLDNA